MQRILSIHLLLALLLLSACHHKQKEKRSIPSLEIEVAEAEADSLVMRYEFVTHLKSKYEALIQPRVNGYLLKKSFSAGMPVRRGDLLFVIDANLLNTTLYAAQAQLASAEAQAVEARNNYERAVPLARINAISQTQLDQYTSAYASARSAVQSARQSLESARLEVSYSKIYSPIDGIIAWTEVSEGDYVGPGTQFTTLTTISNTDTLSAEIAIPTSLYMRYAGRRTSYDNRDLLSDIVLTLADGSTYKHKGTYDYTKQSISPTSGTITLVADFPNPENHLKAGEYGRITTGIGSRQRVITVPQLAINRMQGVESVWVVRPDSTVEYRVVKTGETIGDRWIVEEGLSEGEHVTVTGGQKLHNGEKIIPQIRR